jgi:adenylylsulfate kinase
MASGNSNKAFTILLTGLSAAGKSTLAAGIKEKLEQLGLGPVQIIDSEVSANLCDDVHNSYSREGRERAMRRYIYLSNMLNRNGVTTVIARIAHIRGLRRLARDRIDRFLEVYLKCPLEICVKRDDKGVYARAGAEPDDNCVVGVHEEYEEHELVDLVVDTQRLSPDECVELLHQKIRAAFLVTKAEFASRSSPASKVPLSSTQS